MIEKGWQEGHFISKIVGMFDILLPYIRYDERTSLMIASTSFLEYVQHLDIHFPGYTTQAKQCFSANTLA
jgi:hypothetical protein